MAIYGNMVVPSRPGGALPTNNGDRRVYVPGTGVNARYSDQGVVLAGQAGKIAAGAQGEAAKVLGIEAETMGQQARANNQGWGDLAKGIGALSPMFVAIHERNQRLDMAKAQESLSRLQTEYIEKQREWSQIKGVNTQNMEELKSRWWDEAMPRLTQGLGDYGRRYFNMHADRVGAMADTFIQNHQEQELNRFEATQLKVAMDSEANMINLDPYNRQQTSASIGRIQALIHQDCVRKGLPPDVEQQMVRQAVGTAFGNAIAIQIQRGELAGAQQLFAQYQQLIPADQAARLNEGYNAGLLQQAGALMQSGNVQGLQALLAGAASPAPAGSGTFDQTIAARAAQYNGTKYGGVGGFDCSTYVRTIGKDLVAPQYRHIFEGSSEHMLDTAGKLTNKLYKGGEVNAGTVTSGGWLIGIAEPGASHVKNAKDPRPNKIGHVAMTFMQNGVVMVTENASGVGVHSVPLAQYLEQNKGKTLFAANLNALPQSGGQGVPASWKEWTGERGNSIPERQHNPGAVKPPKGYSSFSSDAEGFLAQAKALRDDKYYAGKTIKDLVLTYVGYNPDKDYWAKIKEAGFRLDEIPDRSDNRVLSRLMVALARGESNLGKHYEPEQVEALLNGGAQPQSQAMPSGVDQSKWDAMYKNARGDAELAAVGYKMGYAKAMEWADGGRKVDSLPKDVQTFLREVKQNGGQPKAGAPQTQTPALPQLGFGAPQGGLSATPATLERLQANYMPQAEATRIWQEASSMKGTERQTFILRQLQGFSANPTMQGDVARILMPQLSQQEKIEEAESRQRAEDWGAKIKGENYLSAGNTIRQAIGAGQITEQEGAMALDFAFGKKEDNVGTRAAAVQIMEDIDRGNITNRQQVEAACLGGRCTDAQTHKCLEYLEKGGQKDQVKISRINDVWKEWMFSQGKTVKDGEKIPYELANYVYADMTPGKIPSSSEIKASIAEGMLKGKGVFGNNYAYEAWSKNDNDWEYEDIPEGLKQQGVTSRAQMWSRVDDWIYEKRPDIKRGQITDAMRRAAMREMMTMPRWGLTEETARRAN